MCVDSTLTSKFWYITKFKIGPEIYLLNYIKLGWKTGVCV